MDEIKEFFTKLFDSSGFPPRWLCGAGWTEFHGWLYIISDLLIWSAYFAIPTIILIYIFKRKEVRFHRVYFLFAAFILSCGVTHLLDAIIFWKPVYRLSALVLFITGVLSWLTVYNLIKLVPKALLLKTPEALEAEVESRKRVESDLKVIIKQMNEAQALAKMGSWEWDVVSNKVTWSEGLFNIYELPVTEGGLTYEYFLQYIHPDDKNFVDQTIREGFTNKKFTDYFHRIVTPTGKTKILQAKGEIILDQSGEIIKMIGTGQDVTADKQTEQELISKTEELEEVNTELKKFAYVASHDLQEPLRKIKTYLSRLETENTFLINDELSQKYLLKITGSATRMQQLMDDILSFSRLSAEVASFTKIDLNELVHSVLADLEISIQTTNAKIEIQNLPVIEGNQSQWIQLFQNLIGNAIKFRKPGTSPLIDITCKFITGSSINNSERLLTHYKFKGWNENYYWSKEKFCSITVSDQGVGFDSEYKEKIFTAFERLHNLSEYSGSGIGLAICRKIADYHHGIIYAESNEQNTAFTVIVPVSQSNFENRIILNK